MENQVAPLALLYGLNTDLLLNCLDGLSDAEAQRRLEAGGNSITFLAGHLTDTRHFLVARLGRTLPNPLARYLADVRSIETSPTGRTSRISPPPVRETSNVVCSQAASGGGRCSLMMDFGRMLRSLGRFS